MASRTFQRLQEGVANKLLWTVLFPDISDEVENLLLDGYVVTDSAKLSGNAHALGIVRSLGSGPEGSTALGMSIVVVVLPSGQFGICQRSITIP